jgi:hypothetical protein
MAPADRPPIVDRAPYVEPDMKRAQFREMCMSDADCESHFCFTAPVGKTCTYHCADVGGQCPPPSFCAGGICFGAW